MADRYPLIANSDSKQIQELAANDNLNLTNNSIVGASTISANQFIGNLAGSATTSTFLTNAGNILSGTINPLRLSGFYNIGVSTSVYLTNASNILSGIIDRQRLEGDYDINITGTASTANSLTDASQILDGIIPRDRLTGVYNIDISGTAFNAVGAAQSVAIVNDEDNTSVQYITYSPDFNTDATLSVDISSLVYNPSTNALGIGLTQPEYNLDVGGSARISGIVSISTAFVSNLEPTLISNLAGIDTVTKSTLETALGFNLGITTFRNLDVTEQSNFNDVNIVGIATIGEITFSSIDSALTSPQINSTNINVTGVATFKSISIGSTQVISSERNLTNISGIDTATKTTFVDSLNVGFFEDLSLTGVGTLSGNVYITNGVNIDGQTNLEDLTISGITSIANIETDNINVGGVSTALRYIGDGSYLTGIVTSIVAGIGVTLSPISGKGEVTVSSFRPIGKTIFVSQKGNDDNSGLAENDTKKTIKAAAEIAEEGDTIKVFPGVYVENNPIILKKRVSVEGTELRNCLITPQNVEKDLFHVNNSVHVTDLSFVGSASTDGAAVIAFQPLIGVSSDRFFDAARMIRLNLDYIAREAVGYITSTDYRSPAFNLGVSSVSRCAEDIKLIFKAVCHDITRGGNSKCVGAGLSYYNGPNLQHIVGVKTETIDALNYAAGISRAIINNSTWGGKAVGVQTSVSAAQYSNVTGVTTITATNHGLSKSDSVRISGLGFTCPSGPGTLFYPTGSVGYTFSVNRVISPNQFEVVVGQSTLPHTYVSGGTVQRVANYQAQFTQVKDLSMQIDPVTKFNNSVTGCANVVSAIYSCVGVVTTIIGIGTTALGGSGINTTYPGNRGAGVSAKVAISSASYDQNSGVVTLVAPGYSVKKGDRVEIRELLFECSSGVTTSSKKFPSGKQGYNFYVNKVNQNGSFDLNVGISTLAHNYVSGGYVVDRSVAITSAIYQNQTGITTITAPGAVIKTGDTVTLRDLNFTCSSGAGTTTIYPTGNNGYDFKVLSTNGSTFTVNVGPSTIAHNYVSGGVVRPPYSEGVGPITQGPYIRNCTNFIPSSIGMRINGFDAELGDQDDIGVTGSMSVDSYTQYNQGGIGVSITNGAYAQLVSIFTICDDIAIFTGSGGQCDITNSNSSFGTFGLVSNGVGDETTKSIYRYTGVAVTDASRGQNEVVISGVGSNRPYDGQAIFFDTLYKTVSTIRVTNGGSGYLLAPRVTIDAPTGPNGITAQATSTIVDGVVTEIAVVTNGTQYIGNPTVTIAPPPSGVTATAEVESLSPLYYTVQSATLPSNGISTISLAQNLNNTVSAGSTVFLSRLSLQLASSHAFEFIGAGNAIEGARPSQGGVTIQENEVVQTNGGLVIYTSTDQAGNFRIGDGVVINQANGSISGRDFTKALFTTMTPFILALT
jgi:hypothetical protein